MLSESPNFKRRCRSLQTYRRSLLGLVISVVRKGLGADILFFVMLLMAFVATARLGRWAQQHKWTQRVRGS